MLLVALGLLLVVSPAQPAGAQTLLGTLDTSVDIVAGTDGTGDTTMQVIVESDRPGVVELSFDDVLLDAQGAWRPVALGSTPHTLQGRIRAEPDVLVYDAEDVGTRRRFEVRLHIDDVDPDATPRAGLLTYQLQPEAGPSGGLGVSAGVATRIRLGAWPEAYDGATAQLALDGPTLRRVDGAQRGIDGLLPELPRVRNRGPGELRARTTNVGEALLQTETSLTLTRLSWWSLLPFVPDDGVEVLVYRDRAALLLPGESRASRVRSTVELDEVSELDRLPTFGPVRVSAEATGFLGQNRSTVTASATYLIVPWKEGLVVLVLLLGVRFGRRTLRVRRRPDPPVDGGVPAPDTAGVPDTLDQALDAR